MVPQGWVLIQNRVFIPLVRNSKMCETKLLWLLEKSQKENGGVVTESFLVWTTSQAIIIKFYDKIIFLKELLPQVNIIVEILRQRPLFLWHGSTWAIKERWTMVDLGVYVLCSAIIETEEGCLLVEGALIETWRVNQITVGLHSPVLSQIPILSIRLLSSLYLKHTSNSSISILCWTYPTPTNF